MGRAFLKTIDDVRENFNWMKDKEEQAYALIDKNSRNLIGNLTVYNHSPYQDTSPALLNKRGRSMSFCLFRPYRRNGYMQEAICAVIEALFQQEGVDYIHCGCFQFNVPSLLLQERLGFTFFASEHILIDGAELTTIENILWNPKYQVKNNEFLLKFFKNGDKVNALFSQKRDG